VNGRSMNSEILQMIDDSISGASQTAETVKHYDEHSRIIIDQQRKMLADQNALSRYLMGEVTAILKGLMPDAAITEKYKSALKGLEDNQVIFDKQMEKITQR
jgi:hypothetical protein